MEIQSDRQPYNLIEETSNGSQLYLSSEEGAYSLVESRFLANPNQPVSILTINSLPLTLPPKHNVVNQLFIELEDEIDQDIGAHLDSAIQFVEKSLAASNNGIVIVHCHAGVSRSATIVWAYMIKTRKEDPRRALSMLRERRPFVNPNICFQVQVGDWYYANYVIATQSHEGYLL